jgi:ABC-type uncharacterized transport system permease subunit
MFGKLPPMANLDRLGFILVCLAFPLLTVGLIAGGISMAAGGLHGATGSDPKVLASVLVWAIYGLYLSLHHLAQWRGPRANYLLLGGLVLVIITLFVPSAHRFG